MVRKYYNCPIKAALMAREFGVKFETKSGLKLTMDLDYCSIWWDYHMAEGKTQIYRAAKFYVAKESEGILKAMRDNKNFLACEVEG